MVDIDLVIFGIIAVMIILIAVTDSRCCNHNRRTTSAWIRSDIETGQAPPPFVHQHNHREEDGSTVGGTVKYKYREEAAAEAVEDEKECCSICLGEFKEDEDCRRLEKCHHIFHKACIDEWFHKNFICPICRGSVHKVKPAAAEPNLG